MNAAMIMEFKKLRNNMERTAIDAIAMARMRVFWRNRRGLK
jgi:hypothetical protein